MPNFEYPKYTPAQLSARSGNAIAVTELVTRKGTNQDISKVEPFYFIHVSGTNKLIIRNDKKELLTCNISFLDGLSYPPKSDYKFLPQLINISGNTSVINTTLGLDWIIPVLNVHYNVQMIRESATTTSILHADLYVWEKAINLLVVDVDRNEIIDKLIEVLKPELNQDQIDTFESWKISIIDGKDTVDNLGTIPVSEPTDPTSEPAKAQVTA
jgi:hypothetical protein